MGKFIDLTGQVFGRWTVMEDAGSDKHGNREWLCHCSCDTERTVTGARLRNGTSKSCGSPECTDRFGRLPANFIDLAGKRFGRWLVLRKVYTQNNQMRWVCRCDCGVERRVAGQSLRGGSSTQCRECQAEDRTLSGDASAFNEFVHKYRAGAKHRGICWELTDNEVRALVGRDCEYCGSPPSQVLKVKSRADDLVYNGIDRVNNQLGYTFDNCVTCCKTCNFAKRDMTLDEFVSWVRRVNVHMWGR